MQLVSFPQEDQQDGDGVRHHFLQTRAWASAQEALGRRVFRRTGPGWCYLAILEKGRLNRRLYVPYGPAYADRDSLAAALEDLRLLGKRLRVTFLRVEPLEPAAVAELTSAGYRESPSGHVQPDLTRIIDLSASPEQLIAGMKKSTRPRVRNYARKGITIRQSFDPADVDKLSCLLGEISDRNAVSFHPPQYFSTLAKALFPSRAASLFIAEVEGETAAVSMAFDSEDTRIYAHAAAADKFRKLQVGTALVGAMILDAKQAGLDYFDLYGVTDSEDRAHPWYGFSKFKEDFGGELVRYAGTWELPLKPATYETVKIAKEIVSKARKRFRR